MNKTLEKYWVWFVYSALTITTLVVFWQVHNFEFTNYDDDRYITENTHITSGLTIDNVRWAFTSPHYFMWHPVTSLTNMLDCQLFGLNAGRHHLTNLILHIANTLLLFAILKAMTGRIWPSAFVAAAFALHPLNVESIAWIAERKNIVSTLFGMLTLAAYIRYVRQRCITNYLLVVLCFSLALMSKPTVVTLPFALLLLDYWPLNRGVTSTAGEIKWRLWLSLFLEKIPLFILSAALSVITVIAQKSGNVLELNEYYPFTVRLANALVSYLTYITKMFWPTHLAVFYPHYGHTLPYWQVIVSVAALLVITLLAIHFAAKYRYFPVGWFWYLGTLVPVIGLVQAGSQAMADRYTYVPLIGLFMIIAWGANDLLVEGKYRKIVLLLSSLAIILSLSVCTWFQTSYWRNSLTLFEHTQKVTPENQLMDNKLGLALMGRGKYGEAINFFQRALQLKPDYAEAFLNLGSAYGQLNRWPEAIDAFKQAIKNNPDFAQAYYNLAVAFCRTGQNTQAIEVCQKAIRINPNYANAYTELGIAYSNLGRYAEAVDAFYQAIRSRPDYAKAYFNLALVYSKLNRKQDEIKSFNQAIAADPDYAEAYYNLSVIYGGLGRYQQAIEACSKAIRINPNYTEAYFNLGVAYIKLNQTEQAIGYFEQAVKIKPDYVQAHYSLCIALLTVGRKDAVEKELEILKKLDADKANTLLKFFNK